MQAIKISVYLLAFVLSNFIVLWFGSKGLIFTAIFLIPFDFVMRCIFHETWKGFELILKMIVLVIVAGLITYVINIDTQNIALGPAVRCPWFRCKGPASRHQGCRPGCCWRW